MIITFVKIVLTVASILGAMFIMSQTAPNIDRMDGAGAIFIVPIWLFVMMGVIAALYGAANWLMEFMFGCGICF